ncbi:MAG TPA: hypothetical protein VGO50_02510 [Pyrinomonadaceae bacterium]|jgi:hypothetical protein|nr:hypothetical protein [Pyrinomonadaceae bacterium]
MKEIQKDSNRPEKIIYFIKLANLLRERTEALKHEIVTPTTIRRVLRFEPEEEHLIMVTRDDYVEYILKGWKQLPGEIKKYLSHHIDRIDLESKEVKFRLETLIVISEFLDSISWLNEEIHYTTYPINHKMEVSAEAKNKGTSFDPFALAKKNMSAAELADFPRTWIVKVHLKILSEEYTYYLNKSLELSKHRFWLENDDTIRFTTSPLVDLLEGIQIKRIRGCKICREVFYAKREDAWACSANCANTLRQRRWSKNKLKAKK